MVKEIVYKMDINQLTRNLDDKQVRMPVRCLVGRNSYKKNRTTGSIVLIDEATNNTVAIRMLR